MSRIKDLFEFDALKTRTLTHIPINLQYFSEQYNLYFLSRSRLILFPEEPVAMYLVNIEPRIAQKYRRKW